MSSQKGGTLLAGKTANALIRGSRAVFAFCRLSAIYKSMQLRIAFEKDSLTEADCLDLKVSPLVCVLESIYLYLIMTNDCVCVSVCNAI